MPEHRDREKASIDATAKYEQELRQRAEQLYPFVSPEMKPEDPVIQSFLNREARFVSLPLQPGKGPDGIVRDVLVRGMELGLDPSDKAFSKHAAEHMVALEAVNRISDQLNTNPSLVSVETAAGIFQTGSLQEDSLVTTYVLRSAVEDRKIGLPLPVEVGNQLKEKLASFDITDKASRTGRENTLKKILKDLAQNIGPDFAVIVALSAELSVDEIWSMLKIINVAGMPNAENSKDRRLIMQMNERLRVGDAWLKFSADDQEAAIKLARDRDSWAHADEIFWTHYRSPRKVQSLAVLGGLDYNIAYLANKQTPEFRNPRKQVFLDRFSKFATTQLITAYNEYQPTKDTTFLSSAGIMDYVTS